MKNYSFNNNTFPSEFENNNNNKNLISYLTRLFGKYLLLAIFISLLLKNIWK